jgi:hypothetical protein
MGENAVFLCGEHSLSPLIARKNKCFEHYADFSGVLIGINPVDTSGAKA